MTDKQYGDGAVASVKKQKILVDSAAEFVDRMIDVENCKYINVSEGNVYRFVYDENVVDGINVYRFHRASLTNIDQDYFDVVQSIVKRNPVNHIVSKCFSYYKKQRPLLIQATLVDCSDRRDVYDSWIRCLKQKPNDDFTFDVAKIKTNGAVVVLKTDETFPAFKRVFTFDALNYPAGMLWHISNKINVLELKLNSLRV